MTGNRFVRTLVLLGALSATGLAAQQIPALHAKALDGTEIRLPRPGSTAPLLLMIGFSHQASHDFDLWNKALLSRYVGDPRVTYVELVDFADVPSFVRSMVEHGMRREVHGAEQSHYVLFTQDEARWKEAADPQEAGHASVLLATPEGNIVWRTEGPPTPQKVAALQQKLASLLPAR